MKNDVCNTCGQSGIAYYGDHPDRLTGYCFQCAVDENYCPFCGTYDALKASVEADATTDIIPMTCPHCNERFYEVKDMGKTYPMLDNAFPSFVGRSFRFAIWNEFDLNIDTVYETLDIPSMPADFEVKYKVPNDNNEIETYTLTVFAFQSGDFLLGVAYEPTIDTLFFTKPMIYSELPIKKETIYG